MVRELCSQVMQEIRDLDLTHEDCKLIIAPAEHADIMVAVGAGTAKSLHGIEYIGYH